MNIRSVVRNLEEDAPHANDNPEEHMDTSALTSIEE